MHFMWSPHPVTFDVDVGRPSTEFLSLLPEPRKFESPVTQNTHFGCLH